MSQVLKRSVSDLEAVESWIRRARYTFDGVTPLTPKNQLFMEDIFTIMSCIWYDTTSQSALINRRWVNALEREPIGRLVKMFKDIDFYLITNRDGTYASFKHWLHLHYENGGQIIGPLADPLKRFFSIGVGLFRLRTCFRFMTRANFPDSISEEDAAQAWLERNLSNWDPVDVSDESKILSEIFPRRKSPVQIPDFIGRFGPGASVGLRKRETSIAAKYKNFRYDALLTYVGHKVDFNPVEMPRHAQGQIRTHRVQFVPKELDKLRVVSMEEPSLMFFQLGIFRSMVSMIRKSSWRWHIDFDHAEYNAWLAQEGSGSREYATIDLSNASDDVRHELVKVLFHNTCLREVLEGTRSKIADLEGRFYKPTYFAPMGSGACFPVETSVFACIVDHVMRQNDDRRAWRVYGDDIVLPSDRYDEVIERLIKLGFEPNREKSFTGSDYFRESCGGDYYNGLDVRPVYVSRFWGGIPRGRRPSPSLITSSVQLANRLVDFKLARLRLIKSLLDIRPGILFDEDGKSGIASPQPTNHHLKERWNADVQCWEYNCGQILTRYDLPDMADEDIRLFEYLRAHASGSECSESLGTLISRPRNPVWTRQWKNPAPGWSARSS